MIVLRLFDRLFLRLRSSQLVKLLYRCLVSCLEAEGDSSVISVRVGKRERVSQIEVTFFEFVFGKIMFWISLSLVGVLFNCYDNVDHHYDALVCIFSTY